ncbi:hypothetical protein AKO1_015811 [Acrasis kona]|uniref:Uncharacterized protein n=1 Tax=Acrasis kona TaxID=1008807 RepID=A0AAW2ZFS5_9EUKA
MSESTLRNRKDKASSEKEEPKTRNKNEVLEESKKNMSETETLVSQMEAHSRTENKIVRWFLCFICILCSLGSMWIEYTVNNMKMFTKFGGTANVMSSILFLLLSVTSLNLRRVQIKNHESLSKEGKINIQDIIKKRSVTEVETEVGLLKKLRITDFLRSWPTLLLCSVPAILVLNQYLFNFATFTVFELAMPFVLFVLAVMMEMVFMVIEDNDLEVNKTHQSVYEMKLMHKYFDEHEHKMKILGE